MSIFSLQKSELDILEWSTNDNLLMLSDNMSSDTLFSTISQFPFPDSREIGWLKILSKVECKMSLIILISNN